MFIEPEIDAIDLINAPVEFVNALCIANDLTVPVSGDDVKVYCG